MEEHARSEVAEGSNPSLPFFYMMISEYGGIGRHIRFKPGTTKGSSPFTPTIKPYSEGKPNAGEEINSHTML